MRRIFSPAGAVEGALSVSSPPSFASNWLAARMGRFQLAHLDLAVKVSMDNCKVAFGREEIDVAVRYGTGDWPGLEAHKVMEVAFTPMMPPHCSPRSHSLSRSLSFLPINPVGRIGRARCDSRRTVSRTASAPISAHNRWTGPR